ncbi:DUF2538 family protein [Paenibacillus sp. NEAU-GSW1]|uniref:DUF2538 family protein n=1 Tax=Paenibacillus sp. NEAU-GSW1 TaxID=2682486 RepID=UPI0012E0F66A|nr:DUF2538 family protein [Paenibacillus sp. NEAU-GSW1]MUT68501.1 DUF2538 family protein [Paenibacillus sp. NEAU-GSW1]
MYFYNEYHQFNFHVMLEKYPIAQQNAEYRVACYIVAHPEIYEKATRKSWENIFDEWMDTEDFSRGIQLLIDLGLHLYGGGFHRFDLLYGIETWDIGNYSVFKQACEIRKSFA